MRDGIPNRPLYFYQKDIIGSREKQISWIGENVEFQPKVSATFCEEPSNKPSPNHRDAILDLWGAETAEAERGWNS